MWFGKRNDLKSFEIGLGRARFDRSRGQLLDADGQPLELRHQSREVLAALAENPGEIVSRQSLIDRVWSGRAVSGDSVAQCIAEIRRVLDDTDKRIVETVPREGYRLVPPEPAVRRSTPRLVLGMLLVMATGILAVQWLRPGAPTERPVIAVLPFEDFSTTSYRGQLSDAVSESIITMLARYPQLTVISRRSSFQFRDTDMGISAIAERLGADFVLEGSQHFDGSQVRITSQLIDGASEAHVWADEIEVPLEDLLVSNNRITAKVANAVGHSVIDASEARMSAGDVSALMISNAAQSRIMRDFTRENLLINLEEQEKAIRDYPDSAWGYLGQALALRVGLRHGWIAGDETAAAQTRMLDLARKAVRLDPNNYMAHHALGRVQLHYGDLESAIGAFRRGTELNPSSSLATMGLADALVNVGRTEEALEVIERLERIDPLYGYSVTWSKSVALWQAGDCEQARDGFLAMPSMPVASYKVLAAIHHCLGNTGAAARAMSDYLSDNPDWTIARERKLRADMWTAPGALERWLAALEAVGMPRG